MQPNIMTQELETKKLELLGEVRLLIKQRESALTDLDRLQNSIGTQQEQYKEQIKNLREELKTLTDQKDALLREIRTLARREDILQKRLESTTSSEIAKTLHVLDEKIAEAEQSLVKAEEKEAALEGLETALKAREEILATHAQKVEGRARDNEDRARLLDMEESALIDNTRRVELDLQMKQSRVDTLEETIALKVKQLKEIDDIIRNKKVDIEAKEIAVTEMFGEAEDLKKQYVSKLEYLQEEVKRIKDWELRLKDREKTLSRGFEELRQKGGAVNGE